MATRTAHFSPSGWRALAYWHRRSRGPGFLPFYPHAQLRWNPAVCEFARYHAKKNLGYTTGRRYTLALALSLAITSHVHCIIP